MHPQLTLIVAQQHIADLHRAADHDRLVHTATTATSRHQQPRRPRTPHPRAAPDLLADQAKQIVTTADLRRAERSPLKMSALQSRSSFAIQAAKHHPNERSSSS